MTYEVQFNPTIYHNQIEIYWEHITAKTKKNTNMYALYGATMILFFFVLKTTEVKYFILGYGVCCLALSIGYYLLIKKDETRKKALIQKHIDNYNKNKDDAVWVFDSEHLAVKDFQSESMIKWSAFQSHKVIRQTLFISHTDTIHHAYIVGLDDVGPEAFNEIVAFVKHKVPTESK